MKKILLVGLSLLMACPTFAKIKLPALVGSNMVLQREREVNLWGEASPSKKVTVTTSWDGRKYTTQSDSDGKWLLKVSTPAAGGPYTIRISDGDPVTLENVMIGEVWVCSGQSNMQMSMTGNLGEPVDGGVEALIEAPKYKDIRLFYTPMVTSPQPVDTCGGEWKVSSSESVAPFSAAAYFFARDLNDALGVPVGLIQTAWGGTRIEAWMPEATAREVEADIVQTNDRFENPNKVGYLYNAMIRPLLNMTARGFIWYQGESNVHTNNYPHYAHYMEKLVSQWRGDWGDPDMPFYFVQLVPHIYEGGTDGIVLPLMIERTMYTEYELRAVKRDVEALKAALSEHLFTILEANIAAEGANSLQIVDKWIDYSMIEEGSMRAHAVLEVHRDIATTRDALAREG